MGKDPVRVVSGLSDCAKRTRDAGDGVDTELNGPDESILR